MARSTENYGLCRFATLRVAAIRSARYINPVMAASVATPESAAMVTSMAASPVVIQSELNACGQVPKANQVTIIFKLGH
jgi:hypothetical protein